MSARGRVTIVVPGDNPLQIAGSPQLERLKPYGDVALYRDRPATLEEKVARARDAAVIMNTRSAVKWPHEALIALPKLRMITVCGVGTDAIDLATAREKGIVVCNLPAVTAPVVAEHAFGLMFAAAKRAAFQTAELRAGRWTGVLNIFLQGKRLGIVGAGPIGAEMARLARAIGMEVVAWTRRPTEERAKKMGVRFVALDELVSTSDVVSLHLPLTPETRHLIGARELGLMKKGAILVNAARGAVVDTAALVEALQSGHLGGAALDAYETEPLPPDSAILSCQQVVLTPHHGDQTPEGMELLNKGVVDNVIAFLEGKPRNVVT
jgi:D-3-phosphoglycerate dehydrogenase